MSLPLNPYRWDSHTVSPEVELHRPELLESTSRSLRRGGSAVLLGGRGLGKSVFLRQLEQHLRAQEGVAVALVEPPLVRTLQGALTGLARALGVPLRSAAPPSSAREVIDLLLYKQPDVQSVILLFDGVEPYVLGEDGGPSPLGPLWFEHLEAVRREVPRLGVLVAGGPSVYLLRHPLGASCLSRSALVRLLPLSDEALARLARPFDEAGRPLGPELLEALQLASGGNPALGTWLLERLWEAPAQDAETLAALSARFLREHHAFVHASLRWLRPGGLSEAPARVLEVLRQAGGTGEWARVQEAVEIVPEARLDVQDTVDLLETAGLVRLEESVTPESPRVRLVSSLVSRAAKPLSSRGE